MLTELLPKEATGQQQSYRVPQANPKGHPHRLTRLHTGYSMQITKATGLKAAGLWAGLRADLKARLKAGLRAAQEGLSKG